MRRLIVWLPLTLIALTAAYMTWPILAAVQIRDAMRAGDVATLNRMVDWDSVRASLKASVAPETIARLAHSPEAPKRSLWQSIKAAVAPRFADTVIDRYVTPEQLPVFLGYRETYKGTIRPALGLKDPPTVLADTPFAGTRIDKGLSFWKRVRRAVFVSPWRLLLEVEDQFNQGRSYTGTLELRGLQWQLTGLSISWL
ncbi:MAG: DUF2939 domain-containing protein [Hyphomicrobiaceae bacterium]|nr:DUF2939 domain-containing protein [Hyphomicrobiaceae bacterium]